MTYRDIIYFIVYFQGYLKHIGGYRYTSKYYIKRIGGERLKNVHFKDMKANETRDICHCGEGTLDFKTIVDVCKSIGVENILVEQDNATKTDDPFMEMKLSYDYLKKL